MAIKNTSFTKGEAVQKLIEVIARVNNKSVAGDTALQTAIDEVREMFKSDEMTDVTVEEALKLVADGGLEPGHMYRCEYEGNPVTMIASHSNNFYRFGFVNYTPAIIQAYLEGGEPRLRIEFLNEVIHPVSHTDLVNGIGNGDFTWFYGAGFYKISGRLASPVYAFCHDENGFAFNIEYAAVCDGVFGHYEIKTNTFTPLETSSSAELMEEFTADEIRAMFE